MRVEPGKILDDPLTLEREAERLGRRLCEKERQVRVVYETVLKSPDLTMVKPRLKYQAARHRELTDLVNLVDKLVDEVRKRGSVGSEEFEASREKLLNFLEAVVAYARYYRAQSREPEGWWL